MFLLVSVILSTGGLLQCMLGYCHPPKKEAPPKKKAPPGKENPPCQGDPPSRPTPKGKIEGDQVQAHTQGGN